MLCFVTNRASGRSYLFMIGLLSMRFPLPRHWTFALCFAVAGFGLGCGSGEAQPEDDPLSDPAALEADLEEQERMIQQERAGG